MPEIGTSGSMSGDGKRSDGHRPPSYRVHPRLYHTTTVAVASRNASGFPVTREWRRRIFRTNLAETKYLRNRTQSEVRRASCFF
jgi:hypothetical protein